MEKKNFEQLFKEQTIQLVKLFLEHNYSDADFEKIEGLDISASTAQRRLTNKYFIIRVFNEKENELSEYPNTTDLSYGEFIYKLVKERREKNQLEARSKGGRTTQQNNEQIKDAEGRIIGNYRLNKLQRLFRKPKNQAKFLLHSIYTFKLTLESLAEVLDMSVEEIMQIINDNEYYDQELFNLNVNTFYDRHQTRAKGRFIELYINLIDAIKTHNGEKYNAYMSIIDDSKYKSVREKKRVGEMLTDDDIEIIIRHQVKYLASQLSVVDDMGYTRSVYTRRAEKVLADNPELSGLYHEIAEFYNEANAKGVNR